MEHNWIYIEDYDFGRGDILQCNYCHLLIIVLWNNSRKLLGQPTNIEWVSDNLYTKYKTAISNHIQRIRYEIN